MFVNTINNLIHIVFKASPILLTIHYVRLRIYDENKYKQFFVNLSYNLIYMYSRTQIFIGNTSNKIYLLMETQPLLQKIWHNILNLYNVFNKQFDKVEYFKDYKVEGKYPIGYTYLHPIQYDFIIATYHTNDNVYKKIFYSHNETTREYEVSNIQFMLIEFYVGGECFAVNLKDTSHNYYVVDNKINIQFMLYYIYLNYPERITKFKKDELIDSCYIKIIDHNVNIIEIKNYEDYILLKKDGYETHI